MKQNKETKAVLMTNEDGQAAFDAVVAEVAMAVSIHRDSASGLIIFKFLPQIPKCCSFFAFIIGFATLFNFKSLGQVFNDDVPSVQVVSEPSTIDNSPWLRLVYPNRGMILVFWSIFCVSALHHSIHTSQCPILTASVQ